MAAAVLGTAAAFLLWHPETPLPSEWNPVEPLVVNEPVTPITGWKLKQAVRSEATCLAAVEGQGVRAGPPIVVENAKCGIDPRVTVSRVGEAALSPVETTCAIALRLAMWERHGLQPAAQSHLGAPISRIEHQSSYSCRAIRTPNGAAERMSLHATAEAIDIKGFRLSDGRSVSLLTDWNGPDSKAAFLRAARNSSCTWFATTLGPDYNSLHADHFHLQSRGWGLCR